MTNLLWSFTERLSIFGSKKANFKKLLSIPRRKLARAFLRFISELTACSALFTCSRYDWHPNWTAAPEVCWLVLPSGSTGCLPVSILGTP